MEELITQVLWSVGTFAIGYFVREYKDDRAVKCGVRALLRDRIFHKCEKSLSGGYCTVEYRGEIEDLYKEYHTLGGNGTVTKLLEKVDELPITPPEDK